MKNTWILILSILLAGCATKPQPSVQPLATLTSVQPLPAAAPAPKAVEQPAVRLTANQTCTKSLTTLKVYSVKSASKYNQEMRQLTRKTSQFISVKENLASDTNNLVMDAYRSRMNTLCYRIETTLGQAMIAQANL